MEGLEAFHTETAEATRHREHGDCVLFLHALCERISAPSVRTSLRNQGGFHLGSIKSVMLPNPSQHKLWVPRGSCPRSGMAKTCPDGLNRDGHGSTSGASAAPLLKPWGCLYGEAWIVTLTMENADGCHNIYENTVTYMEFGEFVGDYKLLTIKCLQKCCRCGTGKKGN